METLRPKETPQTVFDELHITLSAVADLPPCEIAGVAEGQLDTMDIEEDKAKEEEKTDPTERIVGLARACEEGGASLSIEARFVDKDQQEIFFEVQRINSHNGIAHTMSYLASQDGSVYSLIESDGDRGIVELGQGEIPQILEEVKSCRVTALSLNKNQLTKE